MKLIWSNRAEAEYYKNIEFLVDEWSIQVAKNFIEKVDHLIEQIESETVIFKKSEYRDVFVVPVVKQISIYYFIGKENIQLLSFRNNFSDPEKFSI